MKKQLLRAATWLIVVGLLFSSVGPASPVAAGKQAANLPDTGLEWQQASAGLEAPFGLWFSPNFFTNGRVYAFSNFQLAEIGAGYFVIHRSDDRGSTWQRTSQYPPQLILAAFTSTASGGEVILALERYYDPDTFETVYRLIRSINSGDTWTTVWDKTPMFTELVFSPTFITDSTVFAVWADSPAGGIWKSSDGGITWDSNQRIQVHPYNGRVVSLVFSPNFATDQTLMTSVPSYWDGSITWPGGFYRSEDGGLTWTPSDMGCLGRVWGVEVSPNFAADGTVYARGEDSTDPNNYQVYRSTNGGKFWECLPAQPGAGVIHDLAISPGFAADQTIMLATDQGLINSSDNGASWEPWAWVGKTVARVYFSPSYPSDEILAISNLAGNPWRPVASGVFFSTNSGESWQPADIYHDRVSAVAVSPGYETDRSVWASLGGGTGVNYRSTDGGKTWIAQFSYNFLGSLAFNALAASPGAPGGHTLFAATKLGEPLTYRSVDDGLTFFPMGGSPAYGNDVEVSPAYGADKTVWVGNYQGLYRSTSGGNSWELVPGDLPAGGVLNLAVSPGFANDQTLFVALDGAGAGIYRSTDDGAHWVKLPLPGDAAPWNISLSPGFPSDQTVWGSSVSSGIFYSEDAGRTWNAGTPALAGCGVVVVTGGVERTLWTSCAGSLYASGDEGATWIASNPAGVTGFVPTALASAPESETLFVGTSSIGVYRARPSYDLPRSAAITPAEGGALFAWDDSLVAQFPPGAVTTPVTVTLTPLNNSHLPGPGQTLLKLFDLSAVNAASEPVTEFQIPYTLTVSYAGAEFTPLESTLGLYSWDGSVWALEPTSQVDPFTNQVNAVLDHMSHFALGAPTSIQRFLFLPLLQR